MTAEESLARLFESDPEARDYFQRNPLYSLNAVLRVRPWWPPLESVWLYQGVNPRPDETSCSAAWPEAWEFLQELHRQYQTARGHA